MKKYLDKLKVLGSIRSVFLFILLFSCVSMSASSPFIKKEAATPQSENKPISAVTIADDTAAIADTTTITNTIMNGATVQPQQTVVLGNAPAPQAKPAAPTFLWNLQDADILSVINEVSQETGKNFVVDPRVSGKITLISSHPIRQRETYQVFLSILEMLGYSAIPNGKVVKIVPNMESAEMATRVATNSAPGTGDEVVVRVLPLKNVSATQLIPVLRPLLPQWSNVSAYAPGNVLILLGRAANLQRIIDIVQDVDKASSTNIEIVPLHHASAGQLASVLNNMQSASRASGEAPNVSIAADERSNSILLGGPKVSRLKMRVLVSQLDSPASSALGNTEVIYLRYLQAKTLAPILGKIAQNILGKESSSASGSTAGTAGTAAGSASTAPKEESFHSTNIQAEINVNAIIITAPPALMRALKSVISKLDVRPAQVLVEAIIAEIDESNLKTLGIQWGSLLKAGQNLPFGGSSPTDFPPLGPNGASGASGAGIIGIIPSMDIRAVLSVLENTNGVDILSTPSIVVLDNQKATIEVGQQVPEQTGAYSTTGAAATVTPFQTIANKDVTLKMDVTPQINLGTSVRMKIKLKNDSLQNPNTFTLTPIINTNKIENTVIVNSKDVLVIGGLISRVSNEIINKVPILGDVPLLGLLFTEKSKTVSKKNLVVFIKPIIIRNSEEGNELTQTKYDYTRQEQINFAEDLSKVGKVPLQTTLPPWNNPTVLPKPFEKPA